jgi:cell division GTPase FtsZ
MEEIDQINEFVQEVGDDIEVQWGASIDETLGEEVRVTVIATGYKVDGLPSEDAEEGKKTIDEAIIDNYPPQMPKPMEDEKTQLIDLSETLFAEGFDQPQQPKERTASTSADDVVITVEEDTKVEEPAKEEAHRPFAWIRRK